MSRAVTLVRPHLVFAGSLGAMAEIAAKRLAEKGFDMNQGWACLETCRKGSDR